jgi:hypothetical protein
MISILLIAGCNRGSNPLTVTPVDSPESAILQAPKQVSTSRTLWGMYNFYYDAETNTCDVVPSKSASDHWNALRWLEGGPCTNCIKVLSVEPMPSGAHRFGVQIRHPFSNPNYTGFDVRGIAMFNGSHFFPAIGQMIPDRSAGNGEMVNADGWTPHMTPWVSLAGAPDLQAYIKGNFASETSPLATLNGYKRFYSPGTNPRNAFLAGTSITQYYEIFMPTPSFVFGYAVDGCWAPPTNKPVDNVEEDFPSEANCLEAYRVDVTQEPIGQGLHESGGAIWLKMDIYDYVPGSVQNMTVECPEVFDGQIYAVWTGYKPGWIGTARALIENDKEPSAGVYKCLISIVDEQNAGSPLWMDLTAYQVVDLTVEVDDLHGFARTWGGASHDAANDVCADNLGNVYVAGGFRGTVDFDPGDGEQIFTSSGDLDCYLTKFDTSGRYIWTAVWGGDGPDSARGIALDKLTGFVYASGYFSETVDFDPDPDHMSTKVSEGGTDGFITRFDPWGDYDATMWIQGPGSEEATNVDVDLLGYPVACGYAEDGVTFHSSDTPHNMHGGKDVFVVRYLPDTTLDWFIYIGSDQDDQATDVAYDDLEDIIYCGEFRNNTDSTGIDFRHSSGSDVHTSHGLTDAFLIKVTSGAVYEWGKSWGGTLDDTSYGLNVSKVEEIFVCGGYKNDPDFDPGTGEYFSESKGGYDAFLSKYDPDGIFEWGRTWGGLSDDRALTVAVNSFGNPVVGGFFMGTVDFNPTASTDQLVSHGMTDAFITKYQTTGAYLWTRSVGSGDNDSCQGVAVGEGINIYAAGGFMGSTNFAPPASPPDNHNTNGQGDSFLLKYLTDGDW